MRIREFVLKSTANNFTAVRLALASAVIYTHCYRIVNGGYFLADGGADRDDVSSILGAPISSYAVDGFFFLSGFLVYPSLIRLGSSGRFLLARLVRLWPALILSISLTVFCGYFISSSGFPSYFGRQTILFMLGNLSFVKAFYSVTGVICGQYLCNVNESLWTLPVEARCYLALAGLALCGLGKPRWMIRVVLPLTLVGAFVWDFGAVRDMMAHWIGGGPVYVLGVFHRLWPVFALGCVSYVLRDRIVLSWWRLFAFLGLALVTAWLGLGVALQARGVFIGYAVLCFGLLTAEKGPLSGRWPDYSYGMYIFAAPAMMAAYALFPTRSHWILALETVALTAPIAIFSWHVVEKPALDTFRRWRARPAVLFAGGAQSNPAPPDTVA